MIYKLSTGDKVYRYEKSVVVDFVGNRKVLSTSALNGGYKEGLRYVFNHDGNQGAGIACKMKGNTYKEHMETIAKEIGLNPDSCAGLSTAASMDNLAVESETYDDFTVTALVTGGIEVNGGRVGDEAYYHEKAGKSVHIKEGTINIILFIDADLPEGTMARSLVTCTEAKTAAIQELMAGSNYSRGLATGSGTDGTIIVSNADSQTKLTSAGKHSKLGELIGRVVKKAVKKALYLQTELSPDYQYSILKRMKRFGINENILWEKYNQLIKLHENLYERKLTKPEFTHNVHVYEKNSKLVTLTSLYAHLIDQYDWDLIKKEDLEDETKYILSRIYKVFNKEYIAHPDSNEIINKEEIINDIVQKYIISIAYLVGGEFNV